MHEWNSTKYKLRKEFKWIFFGAQYLNKQAEEEEVEQNFEN